MSIRDYDLADIVFTDIYSNTYTIKDMREYPIYQLWFKLAIMNGDDLDEISSREDIYGEDSEFEFYKIAEFNRIMLFDTKFNFDKIKNLDIPVQ